MNMIKDALEKEDLASFQLKNTKDAAYDMLFILQRGFMILCVEKQDKKKVRIILKHIKNIPYVAYQEN